MIPIMDREETIKRLIAVAAKDAGMAGLCRDGQKELALGRIMTAMPDLKPDQAKDRVDAVLSEMVG